MNIKDIYKSLTIANGSSAIILTYTVPKGIKATMIILANGLIDAGAWGYVTWELKINGIAKKPYQSFKNEISNPSDPALCETIKLREFEILEIQATNDYTTSLDITARIMLEERGKYESEE